MVYWTMTFTIIKVRSYCLVTYLIPSSQDFFKVFPHEKNVVMALDKVHPVPCVFLVVIFLFLKILISFLLTKTS